MTFAKRVFLIAGIYGLVVLLPQYFLEGQLGRDYPPPVTHPEHYYGFVGVGIAWQVLFLIISRDPVRYRLAMLAGVLEKFSFGIAVWVLYFQHRVPQVIVGAGTIDLALGVLFILAFRRTR